MEFSRRTITDGVYYTYALLTGNRSLVASGSSYPILRQGDYAIIKIIEFFSIDSDLPEVRPDFWWPVSRKPEKSCDFWRQRREAEKPRDLSF